MTLIYHGILLKSLSDLGLGSIVFDWFLSLLSGKYQKLVWGGGEHYCSSPWRLLVYGVLQRSIISAMLFYIYMKLLVARNHIPIAFAFFFVNYAKKESNYWAFLLNMAERCPNISTLPVFIFMNGNSLDSVKYHWIVRWSSCVETFDANFYPKTI